MQFALPGLSSHRATTMKLRHIGGLLVALGALSLATANAEERAVKLADMDVTVWSQKSDDVSGLPVIVFSHGFHGCATQSRFLMEAFASAGYLVLAPNHRDATCNGGPAHWWNKAQAPFRKPEEWNDATFRDRGDDVRRLIEAARSDGGFHRADWSRLGLAGHSLGGYTVLALAGAWPQWKLAGVKAVLALSPYTQPFIVHGTLSGLAAPVMYQGGTLDFSITPALEGAYGQSPEPKYLLVLNKATHLAWADIGWKAARGPIVGYSLAFLNRYVKVDPADPLLTQAAPGVSLLRHPGKP